MFNHLTPLLSGPRSLGTAPLSATQWVCLQWGKCAFVSLLPLSLCLSLSMSLALLDCVSDLFHHHLCLKSDEPTISSYSRHFRPPPPPHRFSFLIFISYIEEQLYFASDWNQFDFKGIFVKKNFYQLVFQQEFAEFQVFRGEDGEYRYHHQGNVRYPCSRIDRDLAGKWRALKSFKCGKRHLFVVNYLLSSFIDLFCAWTFSSVQATNKKSNLKSCWMLLLN